MPQHILRVKVGAQVVLLRNISVEQGLCNGTRLTVEDIGKDVIFCSVNNKTTRCCWRTNGTAKENEHHHRQQVIMLMLNVVRVGEQVSCGYCRSNLGRSLRPDVLVKVATQHVQNGCLHTNHQEAKVVPILEGIALSPEDMLLETLHASKKAANDIAVLKKEEARLIGRVKQLENFISRAFSQWTTKPRLPSIFFNVLSVNGIKTSLCHLNLDCYLTLSPLNF